MDLLDDFERIKRWTFGMKDVSPEYRNALRRWIDATQHKARARAMLNETNNVRTLDRQNRIRSVQKAVRLKECKLRKRGRPENGLRTLAIRSVARARREGFNTVRKLYYEI